MVATASAADAKLISFVAARPRRWSRANAAFNFVIAIRTTTQTTKRTTSVPICMEQLLFHALTSSPFVRTTRAPVPERDRLLQPGGLLAQLPNHEDFE